MGKSKSPSVPSAPSFQPDPYVQKTQALLFPTAEGLVKGNFLNPNDPTVGFLNPLVTQNNEYTRRAIDLASRDTIETQDKAYRQIINELAANNQLQSSVTGNRLGDLQESFARDLSDINTKFYLADVERSLGNISDLFKTGLNTGQAVGNIALQNQQQINSFNLSNYENQLAASLASQGPSRGGLLGGVLGAVGGGLGGFALGGPVGAGIGAVGGGLGGYFGPSGTGGQILGAGTTAYGLNRIPTSGFPTTLPAGSPSAFASNDVFRRYSDIAGSNGRLAQQYPNLFGYGLN